MTSEALNLSFFSFSLYGSYIWLHLFYRSFIFLIGCPVDDVIAFIFS